MPAAAQPELFPRGDPAPPAPARHFLPWDRPLLERAADWLLERAGGERPIDLSRLLVIVPTRNAGRRLREMLANLAHERGTAVIPPLAAPPAFLVRPESAAGAPASAPASVLAGLPLASELEATAGWIAVLERLDLEAHRALFPVDPPAQDFAWARGAATDLAALKRTLGEAGLGFGEVLRRLPEGHEDLARWRDLAALEASWRHHLETALGRSDREQARARASRQPGLPGGIREVILLGTPDPLPLAVDALEALAARGVPVTVAVYAPEALAAAFDGWGRPLTEAWLRETIDFPGGLASVEVVANPDELIRRVGDLAAACEEAPATLAIGAVDAEIAPLLAPVLAARGVPAFSPEGSRVRQEGFHHLLICLAALLRRPRQAAVREFFRIPAVDAWLAGQLEAWQGRQGLGALDDCHARHLPDTLADLGRFLAQDAAAPADERSAWKRERYAMAAAAVGLVADLLARLERGPLAAALPAALRELFEAGVPNADGGDGRWTEKVIEAAAPVLMRDLAEIDRLDAAGVDWTAADRLALVLDHVGEVALSEDRPSPAIELQGWLELLWEDAPHLIVAGLNDGIVPEAIVGDPYLPENLRSLRSLRLKTNDERFVRDIYLLRALAEPRRRQGRLDLLVPKTNADGDPRRPSRLLFRCADAELPARVAHLFGEVAVSGVQASWSPGFVLVPGLPRPGEPEAALDRLAVTAFATYLKSPFHFWARHVKRLATLDPDKAEMDDPDFGNFCHAVLERYGRDPEARTWTDAGRIAAYFETAADAIARDLYGRHPGLAVRIQVDSAKRRLAAAAELEAKERLSGWEILAVEARLEEVYPLTLGGIAVSGKIDRLERRGDVIRVLDFKTGDKRKEPRKDHCTAIRSGAEPAWPPPYACFDHPDLGSRSAAAASPALKRYRFHNLQLPLYALAVSRAHPEAEILVGYFQLAKASSEVGPATWEIGETLLAAARHCAEGVIGDVLAGRFGRLHPDREDDPFQSWHLGVPEKTLDLTPLGGGRERARTS